MIPEPHRTYVLELMTSLGPAGGGFILAGAQAMKFLLPQARATRDFDFVLDEEFLTVLIPPEVTDRRTVIASALRRAQDMFKVLTASS